MPINWWICSAGWGAWRLTEAKAHELFSCQSVALQAPFSLTPGARQVACLHAGSYQLSQLQLADALQDLRKEGVKRWVYASLAEKGSAPSTQSLQSSLKHAAFQERITSERLRLASLLLARQPRVWVWKTDLITLFFKPLKRERENEQKKNWYNREARWIPFMQT